MEKTAAQHLLQVMIDYFEAGNQQSDMVAKAVIESDTEYPDYWQEEIKRLKSEGRWTGLRGPEAEIIAGTLISIRKLLEE